VTRSASTGRTRSSAAAAWRQNPPGSLSLVSSNSQATGRAPRRVRGMCSLGYRASPNEVTSRSMVDPLRRNDFIYGLVVTSFDEAL
jgi:hypothetical protein